MRAGDAVEPIRERVLQRHAATISCAIEAANAVADKWPTDTSPPEATVRAELREELARRNAFGSFVDVLSTAVDASELEDVPALVPAPPYVTVTSLGPVLRATGTNGRLVLTFEVFIIDRGPPIRYRRTGDHATEVLTIEYVDHCGTRH